MRNLALALGALGILTAVAIEACSDDVDTVTTTGGGTTPAGVGGSGGESTTTSSTSSGGQGGGDPCAGVGGGPCDEACCKLENVCDFGYPVTCDLINQFLGDLLDCENNQPVADCNGQCIMDADCSALPTLLTGTPDPDLYQCLQDCNSGTCTGCVAMPSNCGTELTNCMGDTGYCDLFMQCMGNYGAGGAGGAGGGAPCEDPVCMADCESQHSSAATTALIQCTCSACASVCPQCGSGGAGGS